jgi:apolipoprotein N-acyltransferase
MTTFLKHILYSTSTGLLLFLGWPTLPFPFLLFIAFVPLLLIEDAYSLVRKKRGAIHIFLYSFLAFIIWNTATTWWVCNASIGGGIAAIIANSLLMTLPIILFHKFKIKLGIGYGYMALVAVWLSYEYLHLRWELTWPWLVLGNGFASWPFAIQWYEFTGHLGGSLWILVANIFAIEIYRSIKYKTSIFNGKKVYYISGLWISIPLLLSLLLYTNFKEKGETISVLVVQPNIDPYTEKFGSLSANEQLQRMLNLAEKELDTQVKLVIFPETALTDLVEESEIDRSEAVIIIKAFIKKHPTIAVLTGANTYKTYNGDEPHPVSARKYNEGIYHNYYNTALYIELNKPVQFYYKSKLVPGVEKMPYPQLFGFLEALSIDMGGISGSLGTQDSASSFHGQSGVFAPIICYESVFGDYVGDYVKGGATLNCIITNDGWWGDTEGYRQHLKYASLRAIETRRDIARSANTGISAFINQRGDYIAQTNWWTPAVLKSEVHLNTVLTFYTCFGDYVGVAAVVLFAWLLMLLIFRKRNNPASSFEQ